VFAQFFSCFRAKDGECVENPDVSSLLEGFTLNSVALAIFLIYNPDKDTVHQVFVRQQWIQSIEKDPVLGEIDSALLQKTVEILDKLDVRRVIEYIGSKEVAEGIVSKDALGWFITSFRLQLSLQEVALGTLIVQLQMDKQRLQLLKDERWNGVDAKLLQMLLEATLLNVRNGRESFKIDSWKSLGDFAISYAQPNDAQLPVYQAQVTDLEDDLWMQAQDDYYSQEGWEIEAGSPGDNDYISDDE